MRFRALVLSLPLIVFLASPGCLFSPDKKPPKPVEPPPPYAEQTSPAGTLAKMVAAYQARDSSATKEVYHKDYIGESIDPSGTHKNVPNISKQFEVDHVRKLKENPNIVRVSLDFGNMNAWQRLPPDAADPPEWAQIQINFAQIQVDDINASPGSVTTYSTENQSLTYTFLPTATAPGESTWTIIRWRELVLNP